MTPFDTYQNIDLGWLDAIPSHWTTIPIKHLGVGKNALFIDGDWIESKELSEEGIRYITTGNVGPGYYKEQGTGFITEETFNELNCTEVFPGDLLISRLNEPIGRACIIPDLGFRIVTSVDNVILRPKGNNSERFLMHLFNAPEYSSYTSLLARGATMKRLSRGLLGDIRIPLPPLEEQTKIAAFLDHKTTLIDQLIEKNERLLELLDEQRQAIINEAVTKGLDPNAKMKDSGIDWLGEIPEGLQIKKLKHCVNSFASGATPQSGNEKYHENGTVPWLNTGELNDGVITSTHKRITPEALQDYSALKIHEVNSIVIAMYGATIGKLGILDLECCSNQACCAMQGKTGFPIEFLFYVLLASRENLIEQSVGGGQPNISQQILKNISIPWPTADKQKAIVKHIGERINKLNEASTKSQVQIDLLKEYRQSLISEAVTGKIDLREWEPSSNPVEA